MLHDCRINQVKGINLVFELINSQHNIFLHTSNFPGCQSPDEGQRIDWKFEVG